MYCKNMLETHTIGIDDTYAAIKSLQDHGQFTEEQAEAILGTIRRVELYGVATASDVRRMEQSIAGLDKKMGSLDKKIDSLEAKFPVLDAKYTGLEAKLDARIDLLKRDLTINMGVIATSVVGILAAMKYWG